MSLLLNIIIETNVFSVYIYLWSRISKGYCSQEEYYVCFRKEAKGTLTATISAYPNVPPRSVVTDRFRPWNSLIDLYNIAGSYSLLIHTRKYINILAYHHGFEILNDINMFMSPYGTSMVTWNIIVSWCFSNGDAVMFNLTLNADRGLLSIIPNHNNT